MENRGLVDPKPITIGRKLLARRGDEEAWVKARLLAIKRNAKDERGRSVTSHFLQLNNGESITTVDVMPISTHDAGTVLRAAAGSGHVQLLRALLSAGVHPLAAEESAATALEYAVKGGHEECCRELIAAGGPAQVRLAFAAHRNPRGPWRTRRSPVRGNRAPISL